MSKKKIFFKTKSWTANDKINYLNLLLVDFRMKLKRKRLKKTMISQFLEKKQERKCFLQKTKTKSQNN